MNPYLLAGGAALAVALILFGLLRRTAGRALPLRVEVAPAPAPPEGVEALAGEIRGLGFEEGSPVAVRAPGAAAERRILPFYSDARRTYAFLEAPPGRSPRVSIVSITGQEPLQYVLTGSSPDAVPAGGEAPGTQVQVLRGLPLSDLFRAHERAIEALRASPRRRALPWVADDIRKLLEEDAARARRLPLWWLTLPLRRFVRGRLTMARPIG